MIGIIGAMKEEVELILDSMKVTAEIKKANLTFYKGRILGKEIVLVQCGIGKINASVCTQILISEFHVDAIINTGVAGGLAPDINRGDIVISTEAIHHDFDATPLGAEKGEIPGMHSIFLADEELVYVAQKSTPSTVKTVTGRIASGDIFVANDNLRISIIRDFEPLCVEMEGASIGHTCTLNDIPFVIIRAISDNADGSADYSFAEFVEIAAQNSATTVLNMIRNLSTEEEILYNEVRDLKDAKNFLVDRFIDYINKRGGNQ